MVVKKFFKTMLAQYHMKKTIGRPFNKCLCAFRNEISSPTELWRALEYLLKICVETLFFKLFQGFPWETPLEAIFKLLRGSEHGCQKIFQDHVSAIPYEENYRSPL